MLETVEKIISQDPYEECNFNIEKMFIQNYGKDGGFDNDTGAYRKFIHPLNNDIISDRLINDVKLKLMELFDRLDLE